jgi:FkbM family methyltransferase
MKSLTKYCRYFFEYLKHGDFVSIFAATSYLINKSSHRNNRVVRTSMGTFFCRRDTNDFQFANYAYEWGVKKFLLDHRKQFSVFIDGGAGVGDYCILLSRFGIRCIAFEPMSRNYGVLRKNLELNKLKEKVEAFQIGLGDENKQVRFVFNHVNTGASHIAKNTERGNCVAEIRTFDSMLGELNIGIDEKIFFKLDVEGMENEAINGAEKFIRNYSNVTFIIEDKHSGINPIENSLNRHAKFDFGIVDEFNIYARKTN